MDDRIGFGPREGCRFDHPDLSLSDLPPERLLVDDDGFESPRADSLPAAIDTAEGHFAP